MAEEDITTAHQLLDICSVPKCQHVQVVTPPSARSKVGVAKSFIVKVEEVLACCESLTKRHLKASIFPVRQIK